MPTTTEFSGIFLFTSVPAPIITSFPILTLGKIIAHAPTNTLFPISIFPTLEYPSSLLVLASCVKRVAFAAIVTLSPILIRKLCPASIFLVYINTFFPILAPFFLSSSTTSPPQYFF